MSDLWYFGLYEGKLLSVWVLFGSGFCKNFSFHSIFEQNIDVICFVDSTQTYAVPEQLFIWRAIHRQLLWSEERGPVFGGQSIWTDSVKKIVISSNWLSFLLNWVLIFNFNYDFRRGKPLYLCEQRYWTLEQQWLTHSFDHTNKRWVFHKDTLWMRAHSLRPDCNYSDFVDCSPDLTSNLFDIWVLCDRPVLRWEQNLSHYSNSCENWDNNWTEFASHLTLYLIKLNTNIVLTTKTMIFWSKYTLISNVFKEMKIT